MIIHVRPHNRSVSCHTHSSQPRFFRPYISPVHWIHEACGMCMCHIVHRLRNARRVVASHAQNRNLRLSVAVSSRCIYSGDDTTHQSALSLAQAWVLQSVHQLLVGHRLLLSHMNSCVLGPMRLRTRMSLLRRVLLPWHAVDG